METGNNILIVFNYSLDSNEYQFFSTNFNYVVTRLNILSYSWNLNFSIIFQWISLYFNKKIFYVSTHIHLNASQSIYFNNISSNLIEVITCSNVFQFWFNIIFSKNFTSVISNEFQLSSKISSTRNSFNILISTWFQHPVSLMRFKRILFRPRVRPHPGSPVSLRFVS